MGHTDFAAMACPIARSMAVVGERWTILILREAYYGTSRFDEFQRHLGIAPNILSTRLKTLVEHGMLERVPVQDGARQAYRLTGKARDFFPVFVALKGWADQWMCGDKGPLTVLLDRQTGQEIRAGGLTRVDGSAVTHDDLKVVAGPGAGATLRRRFGEDQPEELAIEGSAAAAAASNEADASARAAGRAHKERRHG